MGMKHAQRWCPQHQQNVLAVKRTPNHILHLLLSVVTLGAWILVWIVLILVADTFEPWRCPMCGAKTRAYPPRGHKPADIRITG